MTQNQIRLACWYAKEHFGDYVEAIVSALLSKGKSNLRQLQTHLVAATTSQNQQRLLAFRDLKTIKSALRTLFQHSMVKFSRHATRGFTEYAADLDRILAVIKYPLMILSAKEMFGDDAEVIVEELLQKGCLTMVQVVSRVTDRLNVAMQAEGEEPIPYSQVQETFKKLVNTRFLERLPTTSTEPAAATAASIVLMAESRFLVPNVSVDQVVAEKKRKRSGDGDGDEGPSTKKQKSNDGSPFASPDDDIYWRMNGNRFELLFRDRLLVRSVENRLGSPTCEVFRVMLRHNEVSSDPTSEQSASLLSAEVFQMLPVDLNLSAESFERHATLLVDDRCGYVSKIQETAGSGATYCLNLRTALSNLAWAHVESFIRERYGVKALRVLRMLKAKGQMEQHKIEELAMMPAKEAKDICYRLFSENVLSLTEIPRTPDHAPSKTIYLFHLQIDNLVRTLLDRSYKTVTNLKDRWRHETDENTRILEKQCKVEGIYTTLQDEDADEEQLREVEEMLSPVERDQLEKVKLYRDKLERTELLLIETILVLEQYLAMEASHGARMITAKKGAKAVM